MLRAHSIDQETWFIARTRCACGGNFQKGGQRLVMQGDTPVDVIEAACTHCNERVEFAFDISPFYGRMKEQQELEQALSGLPERARKKFVRRLGPPMSRPLSFIQQLVNDGDVAALDYLL